MPTYFYVLMVITFLLLASSVYFAIEGDKKLKAEKERVNQRISYLETEVRRLKS